jgi:hypothetical protein
MKVLQHQIKYSYLSLHSRFRTCWLLGAKQLKASVQVQYLLNSLLCLLSYIFFSYFLGMSTKLFTVKSVNCLKSYILYIYFTVILVKGAFQKICIKTVLTIEKLSKSQKSSVFGQNFFECTF